MKLSTLLEVCLVSLVVVASGVARGAFCCGDRRRSGAGRDYQAIKGDVQRAFPMLRKLGVQFPRVVANPPFGLTWTDGARRQRRLLDQIAADGHASRTGLGKDGGGFILSWEQAVTLPAPRATSRARCSSRSVVIAVAQSITDEVGSIGVLTAANAVFTAANRFG